ncbi:AraC family transcriptional regulator ligand-binding domain-containing protein [Pseudomonas sp. NFIX28]|uniref:AraC family transcriptional regulator ligand-binding domain-containing protein n=1 Tax=Pseudomonas sp. NFIX28 TaxID=1566235 RepID=UPI00089917D6|nr:AraC family transcriptional regulator ligand-binding domain-containing protein [Pseudomonas sp. NFIX28]SDZ56095.1 Arabinose-binding domain of AraC transcription regulator, N-term [Pseudomonas sp. NFIX28]
MRELDKNTGEEANQPLRRFHRGQLGRVLERLLHKQTRGDRQDYNLLELEQLWRLAAERDPAIGLHLFAEFTPQDLHVLAYICMYCPDVRGAMQCWADYAALASDMDSLRLVDDGELLGVELRLDAPAGLTRYVVEHYCVMALTQLRHSTGQPLQPVRACFSHPRPAYHAQYRQWFGDHLEFDCSRNCLYYDQATLRLPLLTRHAGMAQLLRSELDRRVAQRLQLSGWTGKVAASMRDSLARGVVPSLENQAEALYQSPRTLRRRLEEQGMTFRQLLDQVRAELEQQLEFLGESRAQMASQLGYGDLAAYLHARKRWKRD